MAVLLLIAFGPLGLNQLINLVVSYVNNKKLPGVEENTKVQTVRKRIMAIIAEKTSAIQRNVEGKIVTLVRLTDPEVGVLGFGGLRTLEDVFLALTFPTAKSLLASAFKSLKAKSDGGPHFSAHEVIIEVRGKQLHFAVLHLSAQDSSGPAAVGPEGSLRQRPAAGGPRRPQGPGPDHGGIRLRSPPDRLPGASRLPHQAGDLQHHAGIGLGAVHDLV
jgi:hypothetical protein